MLQSLPTKQKKKKKTCRDCCKSLVSLCPFYFQREAPETGLSIQDANKSQLTQWQLVKLAAPELFPATRLSRAARGQYLLMICAGSTQLPHFCPLTREDSWK